MKTARLAKFLEKFLATRGPLRIWKSVTMIPASAILGKIRSKFGQTIIRNFDVARAFLNFGILTFPTWFP